MPELDNLAFTMSFSEFAPADVARITGLSGVQQRVWRSRGLLPAVDGAPARFSSLEAAALLARYELSKVGVSPSESNELGNLVAPLIVLFAILDGDGACEVRGAKGDVEHFLAAFRQDTALPMKLVEVTNVARFLWRGDGGEFSLTDEATSLSTNPNPLTVFFLDLEEGGRRFYDRAARPLITVDLPIHGSGGPRVRRLTRPRPDSE